MADRPSLRKDQKELLKALVREVPQSMQPVSVWVGARFSDDKPFEFFTEETFGVRDPVHSTPYWPVRSLESLHDLGLVRGNRVDSPLRSHATYQFDLLQEAYAHVTWLRKPRVVRFAISQLEKATTNRAVAGLIVFALGALARQVLGFQC